MEQDKSPNAKGRPREFDADDALDKAMRVFWRKGYLGTSLSDLTSAMGISRPSLYAAFGNKEELFRQAVLRYTAGPASYVQEALDEPTSLAVVERMLLGAVDMLSCPENPDGCLCLQATLSCEDQDDPVRQELVAARKAGETALRKRFARAVAAGDLPAGADAAALAGYVTTVMYGMAVQATNGATRKELLRIVDIVQRSWPP